MPGWNIYFTFEKTLGYVSLQYLSHWQVCLSIIFSSSRGHCSTRKKSFKHKLEADSVRAFNYTEWSESVHQRAPQRIITHLPASFFSTFRPSMVSLT